jgi:hypothetical protein
VLETVRDVAALIAARATNSRREILFIQIPRLRLHLKTHYQTIERNPR